MAFVRTKICFCLLRNAIMALRGSRSLKSMSVQMADTDIKVAVSECNIE